MNKIVNTYLRQSICLTAGLSLLALLYANLWGDKEQMVVPIVVSAVFQLVASIAYGMVWRKVASSSPGSLPTLYLAASAIRMFAAIATGFHHRVCHHLPEFLLRDAHPRYVVLCQG